MKKLLSTLSLLSLFLPITEAANAEEYKFLKLFEGIIISGNEKIIKPDPEIYKIAIKRFKLEPKNSLFIDDKLINISAAEKLGFKTEGKFRKVDLYEDRNVDQIYMGCI